MWLDVLVRGLRRHGWAYPLLRAAVAGVMHRPWYLRRYPDVARAGVDPVEHYLDHGQAERREIAPDFSVGGYAWRYGNGRKGARCVLHYWLWGRHRGYRALPRVPGARTAVAGRPTVLVCAHSLHDAQFGAERCLLDVVKGLDALGMNVEVAVPSAAGPAYLERLLATSQGVRVLPYGWWNGRLGPCAATVGQFDALLRESGADTLYLNTSVLEEPARAARALGVTVITHVHERLSRDPGLAERLGVRPEEAAGRIAARSDLIIAASHWLAEDFRGRGIPVHVVPNTLDMARWRLPAPARREAAGRRVGMLSSHLPEKGLADFAAMAAHLEALAPGLACVLYGPETPALRALLARRDRGQAPRNLVYRGYVEDPREAIAELDIVVNLSRVEESFGRTLLEAMAAARPVVCYDRGALSELVEDGETGWLVPYREARRVAERVAELARCPETLVRMGGAGRRRALEHYDWPAFEEALSAACREPLRRGEPVGRTPRKQAWH